MRTVKGEYILKCVFNLIIKCDKWVTIKIFTSYSLNLKDFAQKLSICFLNNLIVDADFVGYTYSITKFIMEVTTEFF